MGKIILGSRSPRRADILRKLNFDFEIIPSGYIEDHNRTDFSYDFVENLAYNKALYVAKDLHKKGIKSVVLGADTIVVVDNEILGKPKDRAEAFSMLRKLSGRTHFVVTAVAVVNSQNMNYNLKSETTYVTFENLTDAQINFYIENFKPFDKAGSYGIQEMPDGYVKEVQGSLDNVIGLPSDLVQKMLKETL